MSVVRKMPAASPPADTHPGRPSRAEAVASAAILAAATCLRIAYLLRFRVNTDEPQHLHVAWNWSRGLVPYRDFFDNHTPLFHLVYAPVAAAVGERPEIILWMRAAVLPLWLLTLWQTYRITLSLGSARSAWWAAAVLALVPPYFFTSLEFRADDLWAVLWLGAIVSLVGGPFTRRRALMAGALLGGALAASLKTIFLLGSLAVGAAAAAIREPAIRPRELAIRAMPAIVGMASALVPFALYFAFEGALGPWLRCIVLHNADGYRQWDFGVARLTFFAAVALAAALLGPRIAAATPRDSTVARRRVLVFVTAGAYLAIANGVSPIVNNQDFLPLLPLLVALAAALLVDRVPTDRGARTLLAVAAVLVALILATAQPWRDRAASRTELLADVLLLTRPDDFVMDLKGETVFRPRPFYRTLEAIAIERIESGDLADDVAASLVASRTYVVVNDSDKFPPVARRFLNENYVSVGRLRVAGKMLGAEGGRSPSLPFEVDVPGRYAIVSPEGSATGALDGERYDGPRDLGAGPHVFASPAKTPVALLWARAAELGFSPFHPRVAERRPHSSSVP